MIASKRKASTNGTDYNSLRCYESDASGAFYSPLNKIPIETQRRCVDLIRRGRTDIEVSRMLKLHTSIVREFRSRNAISPVRCKAYRCGGCGCKSVAKPCFICESRRMAGVPIDG
jgi:hypothetical protein